MPTTPDQYRINNKITHEQYTKNKKEMTELLKTVRHKNLEVEQKRNQE